MSSDALHFLVSLSPLVSAAAHHLRSDFMGDKFQVRTKDNALLTMIVSYKRQFLVNESSYQNCFAAEDFVGCEHILSGGAVGRVCRTPTFDALG